MKSEKIGQKVSEFADDHMVSQTTVRRWIKEGYLVVHGEARPTRIIGGEPPLSIAELKSRSRDATAKLRPALHGWTDAGQLQVLVGTSIVVLDPVDKWSDVPAFVRQIEHLAALQGAPT